MIQTVLFVLAATLAIVASAPQQLSDSPSSAAPSTTLSSSSTAAPVAILKSSADGPNPDGSYSWSYESADGTKAEEKGALHQVEQRADDKESYPEAMTAEGAFSFVAPDGTSYSVSYIADENGFRPVGAHLPQAPAVPEAIVRMLKYIQEHPEENNIDEEKKKN